MTNDKLLQQSGTTLEDITINSNNPSTLTKREVSEWLVQTAPTYCPYNYLDMEL